MSTDQQESHAALMELLQEKAEEFAERVAQLPDDSDWMQQMEGLSRAPASQQLASLRLSVALGALDADTALLLLQAFRSTRTRRIDELSDAVIELKELVARPAPAPMSLRVIRDKAGNAVEYRQEPIDLDFEREVSELHRRARGSDGTGSG